MGCRVLPKGPRLTTSRFAGRLCSGTRRDLAHPLPCRAAGGHGASPERLLCQTDCAALVPECLHRKAQPRPAVNNSLHFCLLLTHQWDNWDNFIPPQHCCKNTARPRDHNQHGNKGAPVLKDNTSALNSESWCVHAHTQWNTKSASFLQCQALYGHSL